jgi:hypothetical protein
MVRYISPMPVGSYISGTPYIVHSVVMMVSLLMILCLTSLQILPLLVANYARTRKSLSRIRPAHKASSEPALRHRASGPQFYPWVKDQGWLEVAGPSKVRSRHEALFTWLRRGKLIKLSFGPRKSRNFPRSQKTVLTFFEGNKSVG